MIAQEIATELEPLVRRIVDREVARVMEPVNRRRVAVAAADREILAAARSVGLWTDKVLQATYAGSKEAAHRKQLFAANERLAAVMHRHGRLK